MFMSNIHIRFCKLFWNITFPPKKTDALGVGFKNRFDFHPENWGRSTNPFWLQRIVFKWAWFNHQLDTWLNDMNDMYDMNGMICMKPPPKSGRTGSELRKKSTLSTLYCSAFLSVAQAVITVQSEPRIIKELRYVRAGGRDEGIAKWEMLWKRGLNMITWG